MPRKSLTGMAKASKLFRLEIHGENQSGKVDSQTHLVTGQRLSRLNVDGPTKKMESSGCHLMICSISS